MTRILCSLASLALLLPAQADEAAPQEEKAPATDFIRVAEDDQAARLQTAVTRYEKNGVTVDLIGAVHIADKKYYEDLNKAFEGYEALLFEMIGGEQMVDGEIPQGEGDAQAQLLRKMVGGMARFLQLSTQLDEVDYSKKHFVHADLTLKQFAKKQEEKNESIFSFALAAAQNAQDKGVAQPDPAKLLAALLSGNADNLKLEMIKTLDQGDNQIAALAGNSVIIDDRNIKALKVLKKQVKQGKKNIGIFYGAAHFPDMEKRLLEQGYQKTNQEWMTAWDIPKPAAQPEEQEEADANKKAA